MLKDGRKTWILVLVNKKPERGMTGKYLKRAMVTRNHLTNEPEISFELNDEGAQIFADITREWQPQRQQKVSAWPSCWTANSIRRRPSREKFPAASGVIHGSFDVREAYDLANVLENPLQAPVKILEERSVDPSLGKDSIRSGVQAAIDRRHCRRGLHARLLLIRRDGGERRADAQHRHSHGRHVLRRHHAHPARHRGHRAHHRHGGGRQRADLRAHPRGTGRPASRCAAPSPPATTRRSAPSSTRNLTTLISSVILIFMGTGPVKGFGVTLTIGVAVSMFTALVVTRLIFDLLLAEGLAQDPCRCCTSSVATKIDFMRWAKPAFVASWLLILIGIGYGVFTAARTCWAWTSRAATRSPCVSTQKVGRGQARAT